MTHRMPIPLHRPAHRGLVEPLRLSRRRRRRYTRRLAVLVGVLLGLALVAYDAGRVRAEAGWVESVVTDRAEAHGVSSWLLLRIGACESDRWDPRVLSGDRLGGVGEVGAFQLSPTGLLPVFYRLGYRDPLNLWEAADFTARMIRLGHAGHWSCYRAVLGGWR